MMAVAVLSPTADTTIRDTANYGDSPILNLLDLGGNDRMAYVRFDLSALNVIDIQSAKLTFNKVAGTRNDIVVPSRFDTYGLRNQPGNTPQDWSEATLTNANVGDEYSAVGGNGLDLTRVFNLDQESGAIVSETVSNNATGASPLTLSGEDLVEFLLERADDDGKVTFIALVDAGQIRGYGYASNESSDVTLRPTLEVEYTRAPLPARQVELLNRGVVAVRRSSTQAYVGWRSFGDDPSDIQFNVYRSANGSAPVKLNSSPLSTTTDYVDATATFTQSNAYFVRPVVGGVEGEASEIYTLLANAPVDQRISIPLQIPSPGPNYTYSANDASVGDVDGDGEYEIILKWDPSNSNDNSISGVTGNAYIDAYKMSGELLWRIDMGQNIRAGAHYTQFMVFDLDGDGRSEVAMRTAPGTIDGQGVPVLLGNDQVTDDYRDSNGSVITGPEYLTVFNGLTGAAMDTVPYEPARVNTNQWGDNYGNRSERHLGAVAYLDGQRPSLVFGRGYYGPRTSSGQARNEVAAYDFRDGQLSLRWHFKAGRNINDNINSEYIHQGAHSMSVADVDGDGRDEIIYGAAVINDDGTGLYSTGLGHGDALHVSDMDPSRPGLEVFMVHEDPSQHDGVGAEMHDAATGEILVSIASGGDIGRGVAADIDPNFPGYEMWGTTSDPNIYNVNGQALYARPSNMFVNFVTWWDADLSREMLDRTTISKWNSPGRSNFDLDPGTGGTQQYAIGASSNNGTKSTPALSADILGDWREEVIWRRSDSTFLDIYTTIIPSTTRIYTLMHDTQYRTAIAWQNSGYNQPPHPSFFLGTGMAAPPVPNAYYVQADNVAPTITDLIVSSSSWSEEFIDAVDGDGIGDGNGLGLSLANSDQLRNLPWTTVNELHMQFSEDVSETFNADNVALTGSYGADYASNMTFEYGIAGENIGTIRLSSPLERESLMLLVTATMQDAAGNALDGEWTPGTDGPSGNETAGGDFVFEMRMLPGDVVTNSAVNFADASRVYANVGNPVVDVEMARFDVNTSGAINFSDALAVYRLIGSTLASGAPISSGFGSAVPTSEQPQTGVSPVGLKSMGENSTVQATGSQTGESSRVVTKPKRQATSSTPTIRTSASTAEEAQNDAAVEQISKEPTQLAPAVSTDVGVD